MNYKNKILTFQIISSVFTIVIGVLFHFVYEWSDKNIFVASFSAINESTWEHLKLLFFPMLITMIIGYFYIGKNIPNFLCAKTLGILTALLFTTTFFYTYSGILGSNFALLDIGSFFIAVILGEYIAYKLMLSYFSFNKKICIIILVVLFVFFIVFTYFTPEIGIFKDPITNTYGITKQE